jgi:two-component system OmpR family sensor kinase
MRVLPRTLRGRLIAGLLALLSAACATVGLVTYLAVQRSLTREFNTDLQTATGLAYQCSNPASKPPAGNGAGGQPALGSSQGNTPGREASPSPDDSLSADSSAPTGANPWPTLDSSAPGAPNPLPATGCQGLDEGTFVAVLWHGKGQAELIGGEAFQLSAADLLTLAGITPWKAPNPTDWSDGEDISTSTRYLSEADSTYLLTAISDPDGDGSVYITGVPLSNLHSMLRFVAVAEAAVFGVVLVLAGVLGTLWVRFSLRPLRRVAATASQVAELPLESGEVSLPAGVPDTDPATETGQVGLAFNRMLGHVQTALHRRAASEARLRRFAADASHELRTPLAAIRGYAELALLHPGDSTEAVTHALGRVLSESKRMSVLVDDLLLLARLDAGRPLDSQPVDLSRLAIDATSDAQAARPAHRWILELPDDPVLASGDEHRLHQVLANLLSNAGRHTPDGTCVTVRVSDALPGGEPGTGAESVCRGTLPPAPRVVLTVSNDGPGIPASLLPELFERFTRADTSRSHATNASSTGLGLAIVDAVVGAHGGAVLVTSRPGMTRFAIVLPRLTDSASAAPTRRLPTWPARQPGRQRRGRWRPGAAYSAGTEVVGAVAAADAGAGARPASGPRRIRVPQTIAPNRKIPPTHQNATMYPWTTAFAVTDWTTDEALCGTR